MIYTKVFATYIFFGIWAANHDYDSISFLVIVQQALYYSTAYAQS